NTGKFSFSFGMNIIGGGGSATFEKGLPSFELGIADLVPGLSARGLPTTAYSLDAYFEGSSLFYGYQLGASYEINDMISIYLGARYVTAKNTYAGHLTDVMINTAHPVHNPTLDMISAPWFFSQLAADATTAAESLTDISELGFGAFTPEQIYLSGNMTDAEYGALSAGYAALGLDATVNSVDDGIAPFTASAAESSVKAMLLADQEDVEVEQTGSGITPIIGVNISPNDKLNIGLKYEFMTKLELENNTTKDFIIGFDPTTGSTIGMFPDGEINRNDMPALLTVGVDYQMSDKFLVSTGMHYYFDKNADYGYKDANDNAIKNSDVFDSNYWEWALGLEYNISEKMLISAGYLFAKSGLKPEYQTDLNYKISSHSAGLGGAYSITPKIDLNLAVAYTFYTEDSKDYQHDLAGSGTLIDVTETYDRSNFFIGLGLDFKFGGNKTE
ncbi:MAG: outer membrane protein transport protein, partial [Bacteroidales bacterium]|nr:outer membrane protein transport protein [Bacteroidales bacterium]